MQPTIIVSIICLTIIIVALIMTITANKKECTSEAKRIDLREVLKGDKNVMAYDYFFLIQEKNGNFRVEYYNRDEGPYG
jgi:hypothetical protein